MKLKDYIKYLKKFVKDYGDCQVYTAQDEEGNAYTPVYFGPSLNYVSSIPVGDLLPEDIIDPDDKKDTDIPIVVLN